MSKKTKHASQKKVFTRWVESQLGIKVRDLISDMQNGQLLYNLAEALFQTNLPFKYDEHVKQRTKQNRIYTLAALEQILNYLKENGVKITCVPDDIYSGNATEILGLIWILIIKYHNIEQHRLLKWVNVKLAQLGSNIKVKDFSESFSDGLVFAHLVKYFAPDTVIDFDRFRQGKVVDCLKWVFTIAKEDLNIPRILEPQDIYPNIHTEKVILIYLSYFRNLDKTYEPEQYSYTKTTKKTISAKVEKVNKSIAHVLEKKPRTISVTIDGQELQTLKDEIDKLHNLLAEQEDVIIQQDFLIRRKNKKIKKLSQQLSDQEKALHYERVLHKKFENRYKSVKNDLQISLKNERLLQQKFEEDMILLLQQQQIQQTELELIEQKAKAQAKIVFEMRTKVNHYDHTPNATFILQEMEQIINYNGELLNRVTILECEITESLKKTEDLQAWFLSVDNSSKGPFWDKLTSVIQRLTILEDHYQILKRELQQLGSSHGEMATYVSWLDKELKREREKRMAQVKKNKAWEEKREILSHISDSINLKLTEIVEFNLKGMDSLNTLIGQIKPPVARTHPGSSKRPGSAKRQAPRPPSPTSNAATASSNAITTLDTPNIAALVSPAVKKSRPNSSRRPKSRPGSSQRPPKVSLHSSKHAAKIGASGGTSAISTTETVFTLCQEQPEKENEERFGPFAEVRQGMLKMKGKVLVLSQFSPTKNVERTHSVGCPQPTSVCLSEEIVRSVLLDESPRSRVAAERRVKSTKIPERRAM